MPASPTHISLSDKSRRQGLHFSGLHLYPGVSIENIKSLLGPDTERYKTETGNITYIWDILNNIRLAGDFDEIGSLLSITISSSGTQDGRAYAVIGDSIIQPGKDSIRDIQRLFPYGCLEEKWSAENTLFQSFLVQGGPEGTWAYGFTSNLEISSINENKDLTKISISSVELLLMDNLNANHPRRNCSFR
jgi:hypothetical protein